IAPSIAAPDATCSFSLVVLRRQLVVDLAGCDVLGKGLAEEFDCCGPQAVWVSAVVDAAHPVFAVDQACGGEVLQWLLDGALRFESQLVGEVGRVHDAVALGDGGHDCKSVLLAKYDAGELFESPVSICMAGPVLADRIGVAVPVGCDS